MAILIDPPAWPAHGSLFSHLVSDSDYAELHAFARRLGMPRRAFDLDHYDVPASLYERAVVSGARPVTAKDVVFELRRSGLRVRQVDRPTVAPVRRREFLLAEWNGLGITLTAQEDAWQRLGTDLLARWNEPHRAYHDERHLEDVLLALDQLSLRGERLHLSTLLAAWFHDAVYAGAVGAAAGADERDAANLAVRTLSALGLAGGTTQEVGAMIVATSPGVLHEDPPAPLAHLLDADLAIFAAPPQRYAEYADAVRREYAHVPDADFRTGRAQILNAYLEQPAIYRSATALELWESRARANVGAEITELGS